MFLFKSVLFVSFVAFPPYAFTIPISSHQFKNPVCFELDLEESDNSTLSYPLREDAPEFPIDHWKKLKEFGEYLKEKKLKETFYKVMKVLKFILKKYEERSPSITKQLDEHQQTANYETADNKSTNSLNNDYDNENDLITKTGLSNIIHRGDINQTSGDSLETDSMSSQESQRTEVKEKFNNAISSQDNTNKIQNYNNKTRASLAYQKIGLDMSMPNQRQTIPPRSDDSDFSTTTTDTLKGTVKNEESSKNRFQHSTGKHEDYPKPSATIEPSLTTVKNFTPEVSMTSDVIKYYSSNEIHSAEVGTATTPKIENHFIDTITATEKTQNHMENIDDNSTAVSNDDQSDSMLNNITLEINKKDVPLGTNITFNKAELFKKPTASFKKSESITTPISISENQDDVHNPAGKSSLSESSFKAKSDKSVDDQLNSVPMMTTLPQYITTEQSYLIEKTKIPTTLELSLVKESGNELKNSTSLLSGDEYTRLREPDEPKTIAFFNEIEVTSMGFSAKDVVTQTNIDLDIESEELKSFVKGTNEGPFLGKESSMGSLSGPVDASTRSLTSVDVGTTTTYNNYPGNLSKSDYDVWNVSTTITEPLLTTEVSSSYDAEESSKLCDDDSCSNRVYTTTLTITKPKIIIETSSSTNLEGSSTAYTNRPTTDTVFTTTLTNIEPTIVTEISSSNNKEGLSDVLKKQSSSDNVFITTLTSKEPEIITEASSSGDKGESSTAYKNGSNADNVFTSTLTSVEPQVITDASNSDNTGRLSKAYKIDSSTENIFTTTLTNIEPQLVTGKLSLDTIGIREEPLNDSGNTITYETPNSHEKEDENESASDVSQNNGTVISGKLLNPSSLKDEITQLEITSPNNLNHENQKVNTDLNQIITTNSPHPTMWPEVTSIRNNKKYDGSLSSNIIVTTDVITPNVYTITTEIPYSTTPDLSISPVNNALDLITESPVNTTTISANTAYSNDDNEDQLDAATSSDKESNGGASSMNSVTVNNRNNISSTPEQKSTNNLLSVSESTINNATIFSVTVKNSESNSPNYYQSESSSTPQTTSFTSPTLDKQPPIYIHADDGDSINVNLRGNQIDIERTTPSSIVSGTDTYQVLRVEAKTSEHFDNGHDDMYLSTSKPDHFTKSTTPTSFGSDSEEDYVFYLSPVSRHHSQNLPLPSPIPEDFNRENCQRVPEFIYKSRR